MDRLVDSIILQRCLANIQIKFKTNCFTIKTKTHDHMGFGALKSNAINQSSINLIVKKTYTVVLSQFLLGTLQTKLEYQNMEATIKSSIPQR
mgnify:FL=1|jgi:hypothetical protein